VQIFSDSGLFGFFLSVVIAVLLAFGVPGLGNQRQDGLFCISMFPVMVFYLLAAVLFWPAGAWSSCVFMLSLAECAGGDRISHVGAGSDLKIISRSSIGVGMAFYFLLICCSSVVLASKKYLFLYTSGWFQ
jgi:hypothetical protein